MGLYEKGQDSFVNLLVEREKILRKTENKQAGLMGVFGVKYKLTSEDRMQIDAINKEMKSNDYPMLEKLKDLKSEEKVIEAFFKHLARGVFKSDEERSISLPDLLHLSAYNVGVHEVKDKNKVKDFEGFIFRRNGSIISRRQLMSEMSQANKGTLYEVSLEKARIYIFDSPSRGGDNEFQVRVFDSTITPQQLAAEINTWKAERNGPADRRRLINLENPKNSILALNLSSNGAREGQKLMRSGREVLALRHIPRSIYNPEADFDGEIIWPRVRALILEALDVDNAGGIVS